jgi:hypothetical protein
MHLWFLRSTRNVKYVGQYILTHLHILMACDVCSHVTLCEQGSEILHTSPEVFYLMDKTAQQHF